MFDLLIKDATIIDGRGTPAWPGDAAVRDGRYVAVEKKIDAGAARIILAGGRALSPGFIDIHTHSDIYLLEHPDAEIKVRQGVVLDVTGNCGMSVAPLEPARSEAFTTYISGIMTGLGRPVDWRSLGDYASRVTANRPAIHFACLVGQGTVRVAVMGMVQDEPNKEQMAQMKALVAEAMDQGAAGMSSGLIYPPGCFTGTRELIELAGVVAAKGGIYTSHIRNEDRDVLTALEEAISIGRESGAPVHISHLKIMGPKNWHLIDQMIDLLESARAEGLDVTGDIYPYLASHTSMLSLLPRAAVEGGGEAALARIRDAGQRTGILDFVANGRGKMLGWDKIIVGRVQSDANKAMEGRRVDELSREAGKAPAEFILDLLVAENGSSHIISEGMTETVQSRLLKLPFVMIGSDGVPNPGKPHPRVYGTFPRVIRRYVRELKVLGLEEAVMKMTSMPARRLGLRDRGEIAPGFRADGVLFDPGAVFDTATFADPCRFPEGIHLVMIDGKVVIDGPNQTAERPGRFLGPANHT